MDDPLLVGVLHGPADQDEQLQPLADRELLAVAVLGDRDAADQLHDEVGAARRRSSPASRTLAMLGWSISARACRSASNRATTCLVSIPGLMTFRATLRRTGCGLLGHVDDAHAPLADLLQQLVGADDRAGPSATGGVAGRPSASASRPGDSRKLAGLGRRAASSRSTRRAQRRVVAAGLVEERRRARRRRRSPGPRGRSPRRSGIAWLHRSRPGRRTSPLIGNAKIRPATRSRTRQIFGSLAGGPGRPRSSPSEPGPGVTPSGGRPLRGEMPRASAASSIGQAGEVAELDQLGRLPGPRPASRSRASSRARRSSAGAGAAMSTSSRSTPLAAARRACSARLRRAFSTRMRRMASAAAAKKWPRPSQSLGLVGVRRAGGRPRGPGRWPGASGRASPAPAAGRRACAARRRPAAGAARPPAGRPARWPRGCG